MKISKKIVSMIEKRKDGYYVLSEKGKNLGGPYKSKKEAEERLNQVEFFKHKKSAEGIAYLGSTNYPGYVEVLFVIRGERYSYNVDPLIAKRIETMSRRAPGRALDIAKKKNYGWRKEGSEIAPQGIPVPSCDAIPPSKSKGKRSKTQMRDLVRARFNKAEADRSKTRKKVMKCRIAEELLEVANILLKNAAISSNDFIEQY